MAFHPHHITSMVPFGTIRGWWRWYMLTHHWSTIVCRWCGQPLPFWRRMRWRNVYWSCLNILNDQFAGNHQAEQWRHFHAQPGCAVAGTLLGVRLFFCSDESYQNLHTFVLFNPLSSKIFLKSTEKHQLYWMFSWRLSEVTVYLGFLDLRYLLRRWGACGMTMHGDREGSNALLRSAPGAMLEASCTWKMHRVRCYEMLWVPHGLPTGFLILAFFPLHAILDTRRLESLRRC